jgi:hypothetical protein
MVLKVGVRCVTHLTIGLVTFLSFLVFGVIPLLAYVVATISYGSAQTAGMEHSTHLNSLHIAGVDTVFIIAIVLAGTTMFALGAITVFFYILCVVEISL